MIPKRIELENFLSFGPKQEIHFDDGEPLWVLGGPNGVGKSTVFDAITFCLFGVHRGGKIGLDNLVRHGANGFSVSLHFEFNGREFRIVRNRSGAKTNQSLMELREGTWASVPNVENATQLNEWVQATLGLAYEAFSKSVLLGQGKADDIITETGTKRLEMLKSIIGLGEYVELSERVHGRTSQVEAKLKQLQATRATLPDVTPEQFAEALVKLNAAELAKQESSRVRDQAIKTVSLAEQWEQKQKQQLNLSLKIEQAEELARNSEQLTLDKTRLDELNKYLPGALQLSTLTTKLATQLPKTEQLAEQVNQLKQQELSTQAELQAQQQNRDQARASEQKQKLETERFTNEVKTLTGWLKLADDVAKLDAELAKFSPELAQQFPLKQAEVTTAQMEEQAATKASNEAELKLSQTRKLLEKFEKLETGVPCSSCGQPVTEAHREKELNQLRQQLALLEVETSTCQETRRLAIEKWTRLKQEAETIQQQLQEQKQFQQRRTDRVKLLESQGGHADVPLLQTQLATVQACLNQARSAQATASQTLKQAEAEVAKLVKHLELLKNELEATAKDHAKENAELLKLTGQRDALHQQLPEAWLQYDSLELRTFQQEQSTLQQSEVAQRYEQWKTQSTLLDEWRTQLLLVQEDMERVPPEARLSKAEAERQRLQAVQADQTAEAILQSARDEDARLRQHQTEIARLTNEIAETEKNLRVHARLDDLLGKKGLQRELVREAEKEIVRHANEIVQNLSDGDLRIELSQAEKKENEALVLLVRRADNPKPTPVEYLSGSQKFRVAIAIALAIGQYAAGQARPLECVIIDEGFGSLDKQGLQAAAEELKRLKQRLKRIILVSHQEEFTEHFPAVIQLKPGGDGTQVEVVRRR